jgi:putative ABC transport system permease protein
MLRNYLKTAVRNLVKYKGHSLISIFGLSIGMTCCMLIFLYVRFELSFDTFNSNSRDIRRVIIERSNFAAKPMDITTPPPLAEAMKNEYQWIEKSVRFLVMDNPVPLVSAGSNKFYEKRLMFSDPDIFSIFSICFISGNPKNALQKPNTIVITKETAGKYFGSENPIGKTLSINNNLELEVAGVTENMPPNSTIKYDFLISFSTLNNWLGNEFINNWQNNTCETYLRLSQNNPYNKSEFSFGDFVKKYQDKSSSIKNIHLQPLERIHLYSQADYNILSDGDIKYINLLIAISVLVLLIACFNYINLISAQLINRVKEMGIRNISGASKKDTFIQIMGECSIIPIVSSILSIILVEISLPSLCKIMELRIDFFNNLSILLIPGGIVLFISILAGLYPAFILSSFKAESALKRYPDYGIKGLFFRKGIVALQYAITIILIIGSVIIYKQMKYIREKNLGFNKEGVMVIPIRDENLRKNPEPLKNRLRSESGVLQVGAAALLPGGPVGKVRYKSEGMNSDASISMLWVDQDFIKILGMEIIAGRDFSREFQSDKNESFIINEEAVKANGWNKPEEAIGKKFELNNGRKGNIIGVVKDFNFTSLHKKIAPAVLYVWPWLNYILVKIDMNNFTSLINNIHKVYNEFDALNPFTYTFLEDGYEKFYRSEKQLEIMAELFTVIALVIAGLGLFSISSFTINQRKKEIGIRKVCGASTGKIILRLNMEFIKWILIANIFAIPLAWYLMNLWLEKFAYRIFPDPIIFISAGIVTFIISFGIVSYNGIRSALINPVESLRNE